MKRNGMRMEAADCPALRETMGRFKNHTSHSPELLTILGASLQTNHDAHFNVHNHILALAQRPLFLLNRASPARACPALLVLFISTPPFVAIRTPALYE